MKVRGFNSVMGTVSEEFLPQATLEVEFGGTGKIQTNSI